MKDKLQTASPWCVTTMLPESPSNVKVQVQNTFLHFSENDKSYGNAPKSVRPRSYSDNDTPFVFGPTPEPSPTLTAVDEQYPLPNNLLLPPCFDGQYADPNMNMGITGNNMNMMTYGGFNMSMQGSAMGAFPDASSCMSGICPIIVMTPEGGYEVQQTMFFQPGMQVQAAHAAQAEMSMGGEFSQGDVFSQGGAVMNGVGMMMGTMNGSTSMGNSMMSMSEMGGMPADMAGMSNMAGADIGGAPNCERDCFELPPSGETMSMANESSMQSSLIPPSPQSQQVAQMDRMVLSRSTTEKRRNDEWEQEDRSWTSKQGWQQQPQATGQPQQASWSRRQDKNSWAQQQGRGFTPTHDEKYRSKDRPPSPPEGNASLRRSESEVNFRPALPENERTTVMLRNVPNKYTTDMLKQMLDSEGYACTYDFLYLPMDFRNRVNIGYAFINFLRPEIAQQFKTAFEGFDRWVYQSRKVCEVAWSHPHQGLAEHVERYRNSPVMHSSMPADYKPRLYRDGEEVPFPPPTRQIRPPKLRTVPGQANGNGGASP